MARSPVLADVPVMAVKNQGPDRAICAFETHVTATVGAGREVMAMAGTNSGGFENRASQEQGTH